MKRNLKRKIGLAPSMASAAGKMGLSKELLKRCKRLGWSCFESGGRVDCDGLAAMLAEHPELMQEVGDVPDKHVEDALLTRARRMLAEHELEVSRRDYIPAAEVRRDAALCILATKQKLYAAIDSVTAAAAMKLALSGEQQSALRQIVHDSIVSALKDMHRGAWGEVTCPNCEKGFE